MWKNYYLVCLSPTLSQRNQLIDMKNPYQTTSFGKPILSGYYFLVLKPRIWHIWNMVHTITTDCRADVVLLLWTLTELTDPCLTSNTVTWPWLYTLSTCHVCTASWPISPLTPHLSRNHKMKSKTELSKLSTSSIKTDFYPPPSPIKIHENISPAS